MALAALAPQRVIGVVACCSMTDMAWAPARATMSPAHAHAVWDAPDREAAIAAAVDVHGENGSKMLDGGMAPALASLDAELFADPSWMRLAMVGFPRPGVGRQLVTDSALDRHDERRRETSRLREAIVRARDAQKR